MSASHVYLKSFLAPLSPWLDRSDITDVLVNRAGEVWFEAATGGLQRADAPEVTDVMLLRLAQQVAAASHQGVSREHPLLAASLPDGARVQIVAPPATRGSLALAIRKHVVADLSLDDYARAGAFVQTRTDGAGDAASVNASLHAMLRGGDIAGFLHTAVRAGKTIVVSGGTSSGKTTLLNALLKEAPSQERVIVIEDTPEVLLSHANAIGLVAVKGEAGEARVSVNDLMQAALRMRPDRLLVGEIRGAEAYTFLRAINTGHPGSITTVHADSPHGALEQIAFMTLESGIALTRADVIAYARSAIDIIVQVGRVGGRRVVRDVAFMPDRQ